jgi:hypothetical protein
LSTPTDPFSHGFRKCSVFQSSTSACLFRFFASDHTIPTWSNLSSTEVNCSGLRLCVKDDLLQACVLLATEGDRQLADSLVSVARMPARPLVRYQGLHTTRSFLAPHPRFFKRWLCRPTSCSAMRQRLHRGSKQASVCYKKAEDLLLLSPTTRNGSSSKTSPRKCRMTQTRNA